jgi:hypothetical protein
MIKKPTSTLYGAQVCKSRGYTKIFNTMWSAVLLLVILFTAGCKKDKYKGEIIGKCPVVVTTDPMDKAVDVVLDKVISITFNTNINAATISKTTFTIKQGTTLVSGTISPTPNGAIFTFKPDVALLPFTVYTGTVTTGATDTLRTALANDYVWTFTTIPFVTLASNPVLGGITTGMGAFAQGSAATVTATPNTGFVFTNWTENGTIVSTSSSYQFTIAGNRTLTANFAKVNIGSFAVVLSSSPLAGGKTGGSGSYKSGSSVTTTATPSVGYTFVNWTDNGAIVSTSSSYQFTLTKNRTLVANFKVIPASQFAVVLSSNPPEGGTTNGSGAYAAGTSVTVTATKNIGYSFTNWTENSAVVSTSPSYTFPLSSNRTLVANFTINTYTLNVTAINGTVVKTPNQATYNSGTTVQLKATASPGYKFLSWSGDASGSTNPLVVTMNSNKAVVANFVSTAFTLNVTAINGTVLKTPNQATYNSGATVQLKATPNTGFVFSSWSGDATGSINPLVVTMNSNKTIAANFKLAPAIGPGPIDLGGAGIFTILTKSGISTTGVTSVGGNIGVSPASATAITGFGLIMNANGQSSHTPIVTGSVFAADYAAPTPSNMTTAVNNMQTAYTTANGLVTPAPIVDLYAGNISGKILPPGLYKYSTGVLITSAGVTLAGGPNDTWVFQISQDLTVNNSAIIKLTGGAQAKNIYWVVAGQATLGTNVNFSGNILSKTLISLNTGTKVKGRLLAQTAVTLNASTVILP